jgi:hypothetical protein
MSRPSEFPVLSDGATELLRIARENDKHRALARNAALLKSLKFTEQLILVCRGDWRKDLAELLGVAAPTAFVGLASQSLRTIQREVDELFQHPPADSQLPVVTDFNIHALQGEAQMLADFAWPGRAAADFDGPPLGEVVGRLGSVEVRGAWTALLQHYLGNILQDVFASARIREAIPDLDPEAETWLRSRDARDLSEYVLGMIPANQAPDAVEFMLALDQAVDWATE